MSISIAQQTPVACPACGQRFDADIWLIVDVVERPDLLERIRAGTLHDVTCLHCHQAIGQVDAPLLVYRPNAYPAVLFSPAQQTTQEQDHQQAMDLLNALRERLGDAWQDAWLAKGLPAVQRAVLHAMFSDNPEQALRDLEEQARRKLEELRQRDPQAYARLVAAQGMIEEGGQLEPELDLAPKNSPLAQLLLQFLRADSWSESYRIVMQHTELVSEDAIALLEQWLAAATTEGDAHAARILAEHRDLLRRSLEVGATAAFAEKLGISPQELEAADPASQLELAVRAMLAELEEGASITSAEELQRRLEMRPDLCTKLDMAIRAAGRSAAISPDVAMILAVLSRPENQRNLPRRIELCRQALALVARDHNPTLWAKLQGILGESLAEIPYGERAMNIEQAIDAYQQALEVQTRAATPIDWAHITMNLANAYADRIQGDRAENLERAIGLFKQVLQVYTRAAMPIGWARTTMNLATVYRERIRGDRAENLERAISLHEQALEVRTRATMPIEWATTTSNLATAYRERIRGERAANLEHAIALYEQAFEVRTRMATPIDWAQTTMHLALAYSNRIRGERAENLEHAIDLYEQVLQVNTRADMPIEWAYTTSNLATAYWNRIRSERAENLERAISLFEQALEVLTRAVTPTDWATGTMNLALAYSNRIRGERAENLERAIALFEQALEVRTRADMPIEWAITTINLANAYRERIRGERAENLEHAISLYEQALEVLTRADMPFERALITSNLAIAYKNRVQGERAENIERAISLYEQALEVRTRADMPIQWAITTNNLASAYTNRIRGERAENLERAITLYNQALEVFDPATLPRDSRLAARALGNVYFGEQRWQEAGQAYARAVWATETLYQTALSRSGKDDELDESADLYRATAYTQARSSDLRGAAVALERGRARGLGETLARDRADLAQVQQMDPQAYAQYTDAAARMRQFETAERGVFLPSDSAAPRLLPADLRAHAEQARADLDTAIERIRAIPGYQDFLALPDWDNLTTATQPGRPLVYLVTTSAGSLALILQRAEPTTDPAVTPVWLDGLTESQLRESLAGPAGAPSLGGWLGAYNRRRADWQGWLDTLDQITGQLWDTIMAPVLDHLQMMGARQAILTPTGLLALLPLHAAWTSCGEKRTYALDQLALSYTPSARVLTSARRTAATMSADWLLAVDEPQPVSANPLPSSEAEVTAIADLFDTPLVLRHTAATRQAVLDALPQMQVAHFSCHGGTDWTDPLQSGLLLADDEVLTVQDLFALNLTGARLATLSACETGIIGTKLPDEVVALPAAFLRAGFAGVAASLWSVADLSTAMLMARFYQLWRQDGLEPAEALRQAQFWLRDTTNGEKRQYFEQFLPEFTPDARAARLPTTVADVLYKEVVLADDAARGFAHPFHWAAFQYIGV